MGYFLEIVTCKEYLSPNFYRSLDDTDFWRCDSEFYYQRSDKLKITTSKLALRGLESSIFGVVSRLKFEKLLGCGMRRGK